MLTAKQEAFCRALVSEGLTAAEAYRRAYSCSKAKPTTVQRKATALMGKATIRARVAELRDAAAEAAKVTLEGHLDDLLDLRNRAAEAGDFGPAVRAEIARGHAAGLLQEKVTVTHQGKVVLYIPDNGRNGGGA